MSDKSGVVLGHGRRAQPRNHSSWERDRVRLGSYPSGAGAAGGLAQLYHFGVAPARKRR